MVTDLAEPIDTTLAALADPTRRRIVDLLREQPRRAGEVAERFEVSGPAISRHLRVLRTSGLIEEARVERDARVRLYRLRPEPFADLERWLADLTAFWNERLDALDAYLARRED